MASFPVMSTGQIASDMQFTEVFSDTFDGTGPGPGQYWGYDTMDRALNRVGNYGQDANGNLADNSVDGKRWAAWYNGNNDLITYRENGILKLSGRVEYTTDPTRESYTHNGTLYDWNNRRAYAQYLVQWHRMYSQEANGGAGGQVTDPAYPDIYFGPGHYIECRLSVEQMRTKGFRVSLWFMPYGENAGNAYNADTGDGVEVDVFEIENSDDGTYYGNNRIQSKVLGGDSGKTEVQSGGNVDLSAYNLNQGFHTVGCLWRADGLYWFIDGVEYIRDLDNVPQEYQFLSLTRELNAGVKNANEADGNDIPSNGVKRPVDVGLYNVSSFPHLDTLDQCVAQIDYIKVWAVDGDNGFFNGGNVADAETGSGDGGLTVDDPDVPSDTNIVTAAINRNAREGFYAAPSSPISAGRHIQIAASIPEGGDPDDYTYSWSVTGSGIQIISGQDQFVVTLAIDQTAPDQDDASYSCDINAIVPPIEFISPVVAETGSTSVEGTVTTSVDAQVTLQRRVGTSGFWVNGNTGALGTSHTSTIDGLEPSQTYQFRFYTTEGVSQTFIVTMSDAPVILTYTPVEGEYV